MTAEYYHFRTERIAAHDDSGGWVRVVEIDEQVYQVGVKRGRRTLLGIAWQGFVCTLAGVNLWSGRVNHSEGCRSMLRKAGLLVPGAVMVKALDVA